MSASPLVEPGEYLACRIAVEAGDDAEGCLVRYLARSPRSPHDLDVRGLLAELAFRTGGCAAVAPRARILINLYPDAALAVGWRRRCPELR
jgi:hypothetical protein